MRRSNVGVIGEEEGHQVDILERDVWIGRLVDFGRHNGSFALAVDKMWVERDSE